MSLFVISDLHLSVACPEKAMDTFGARWTDYIHKIRASWNAVVGENDTVIVPGDISWAMNLEEAIPDLEFIHHLNGKKILMKGNHDFWWTSLKKMQDTVQKNGFDSISFLHNSAIEVENQWICGTRGWFQDEKSQVTVGETDYKKITQRELIRLGLSLKARPDDCVPLVMFHFPPVWNGWYFREMLDLLLECDVRQCYFGHIHGVYNVSPVQTFDQINFHFIAADYLNFVPHKIP
mgnify:CR=1 FL=1